MQICGKKKNTKTTNETRQEFSQLKYSPGQSVMKNHHPQVLAK